jgi:hypothetical protein
MKEIFLHSCWSPWVIYLILSYTLETNENLKSNLKKKLKNRKHKGNKKKKSKPFILGHFLPFWPIPPLCMGLKRSHCHAGPVWQSNREARASSHSDGWVHYSSLSSYPFCPRRRVGRGALTAGPPNGSSSPIHRRITASAKQQADPPPWFSPGDFRETRRCGSLPGAFSFN